ncbi:methionine ABC transporter membrane-anchored lipoprotein MetQ [Frischella sp. Ac48]|uniref:Lipoprotein n=1 Tax=Frischella japonica TaxID=2741544 RepID=A0ABR7QU63_9GAMM|nr:MULTISPECIES: MetQ/NlpA family ABC transporter substrate-binding protein [Frischella]MBC9129744.1 methionine ABC transporter membrane-anchored lipoprotein MetQ [Frischella japonica]MBX4132734.1 methionine ABC transporter membrane-anchored lipoprotein MetQ [Frischella sp. Ac48]
MLLKKLAIVTALASSVLLTACDNKKSVDASIKPTVLKVGVVSGPDQEVAEATKEQAKKLYNLDVELVIFNDYVIPNQALDSKQIDINDFQHQPFLDQQIEERGYKLVSVGKTFVHPIAAYTHKLKPITDVVNHEEGMIVTSPRGESYLIKPYSTVAIPNDPTNLGRALLLLQKQGLITVNPDKGLFPAVVDITDNPYHLNILEIEAPLLPRSLDDAQVDFAIINNAFAGQINLTANHDGIFVEDKDSPYVNIIVAREDNKDDPNIVKYINARHSDAAVQKANEVFNGSAVKGW